MFAPLARACYYSGMSDEFLRATDDLEEPILRLLRDTIGDPEQKIQFRLKAAQMILDRRVPTLSSMKVEATQPVQIFYISPQELARRRLAGETSLELPPPVEE